MSVQLSTDGRELAGLLRSLPTGRRTVLGVAGAPGAGKSTLAAAVVGVLGARSVVVPLDGFHLADVELRRQGLIERKGAPETFDAWGYAALLDRIRDRPDHVVHAPGFERDLEQPLAGAVAVPPDADVVVTEGNYLLLPDAGWRAARAAIDVLWFVHTEESTRRARLHARHVGSGKGPAEASRWVEVVDEPNAVLVEASRAGADLVLDLTDWGGRVG